MNDTLVEIAIRSECEWEKARRKALARFPDGMPREEADKEFEAVLALKGVALRDLLAACHGLPRYEFGQLMDRIHYEGRDMLLGKGDTFHIDDDKLAAVMVIFSQETDPKATPDMVRAEICADWNDPVGHQNWLDHATPQEICDWLGSFYTIEPEEESGY